MEEIVNAKLASFREEYERKMQRKQNTVGLSEKIIICGKNGSTDRWKRRSLVGRYIHVSMSHMPISNSYKRTIV